MTLDQNIKSIKDKAEHIDKNSLFTNPEVYFDDIIDLITMIEELETPTKIDIKTMKKRIHLA